MQANIYTIFTIIGIAIIFWLSLAALSLMKIASQLEKIQKQIRK